MTISTDEKTRLDQDGFVVLHAAADPALVAALLARIEQRFAEEGDRAGAEFRREQGSRRLANLVDKGEVFHQALQQAWLDPYVAHLLGPDYKLSSMNARSVNAGWSEPQPLHADMGAIADERGPWVANVVWMLDPFTRENGALRLVPGSHRFAALPGDVLADPAAPHPDEIVVTGERGTLVVYNAHLWHGGLANRTAKPRTALHAFFCRRDKPQQQYQKRLLRPEVLANLSPRLRELLAIDDPENDRLSAGPVQRSGFLPEPAMDRSTNPSPKHA